MPRLRFKRCLGGPALACPRGVLRRVRGDASALRVGFLGHDERTSRSRGQFACDSHGRSVIQDRWTWSKLPAVTTAWLLNFERCAVWGSRHSRCACAVCAARCQCATAGGSVRRARCNLPHRVRGAEKECVGSGAYGVSCNRLRQYDRGRSRSLRFRNREAAMLPPPPLRQ